MIVGVSVVPTTPLVLAGLPGRPHPQIAALGAAARRATQALARADVVVALAGGPHLGLGDPPDTDLSGYGLTDMAAHDLLSAPTDVAQVLHRVVAPADAPSSGPDLAVLARHVPAGTACMGITIPPDIDRQTSHEIAQAIMRGARGTSLALLVAGDLAAGHGPKPPRPHANAVADTFDGLVVAALDGGRPADLVRLDPAVVTASASRAAGALRVLGTVLDLAKIGTVVRASGAPLGVGYVVAQGG